MAYGLYELIAAHKLPAIFHSGHSGIGTGMPGGGGLRRLHSAEDVERARPRDAVGRLLGASPRAAVAAVVDALDAVDSQLLDELERVVAERRRAKRGA